MKFQVTVYFHELAYNGPQFIISYNSPAGVTGAGSEGNAKLRGVRLCKSFSDASCHLFYSLRRSKVALPFIAGSFDSVTEGT